MFYLAKFGNGFTINTRSCFASITLLDLSQEGKHFVSGLTWVLGINRLSGCHNFLFSVRQLARLATQHRQSVLNVVCQRTGFCSFKDNIPSRIKVSRVAKVRGCVANLGEELLLQIQNLNLAILRVKAVNAISPSALGFWVKVINVVNFKIVELFLFATKSKTFNWNILVISTLNPIDITRENATY